MSVKHDLSLVNPCWLFPVTCFIWLAMAPWRMCSIIFLETEVTLMCLKCPESFFNPFLQMEVILGFFPSSGTSPSIHNHSEIMESSFPVLSSSSQHPQGDSVRAPWRPSRWHRPHTNSSFPDNGSVCTSAWGSVPRAWGPTVLARRELEKVWRTFAFSVSLMTSLLFNTKTVFPSSFCLAFTYLKYPSLWLLTSLANFNLNSIWIFCFLTGSLHALGAPF